ncbi:uncharacterized protein SCHCODRAFT_02615976 [Schizophyllum commune H4-8]|uniref:uncharacterized protein n=1 Tax=Schizophyllum commune (strain H4-8 / FGSC 9210) TaxID=578458 RepID=UPI00216104F1|nr:uncharacterized protein SCHCODRAFT_02615976 [Schizophyllum commune H4-8]KAI5896845.1 hypothetical protein SCHCODRAFT_02615976 [Schizophyllum commune H4-8]
MSMIAHRPLLDCTLPRQIFQAPPPPSFLTMMSSSCAKFTGAWISTAWEVEIVAGAVRTPTPAPQCDAGATSARKRANHAHPMNIRYLRVLGAWVWIASQRACQSMSDDEHAAPHLSMNIPKTVYTS